MTTEEFLKICELSKLEFTKEESEEYIKEITKLSKNFNLLLVCDVLKKEESPEHFLRLCDLREDESQNFQYFDSLVENSTGNIDHMFSIKKIIE